MHLQNLILALSSVVGIVNAIPFKRQAACSSYTLLNTRGTTEPQAECKAFLTMNSNIMSQVSGGKIYNTVYAASLDQDSAPATQDIMNHIQSTLATNPDECFILQGYSQGATATVNALPNLTGAAFDAVKGVFLIGNPEHKSGLTCNIDNNGGTTTRDVNGLEAFLSSGIPDEWVSKTMDLCIFGDGVCDTRDGIGITLQHLEYTADAGTQNLGATFAVGQLQAAS